MIIKEAKLEDLKPLAQLFDAYRVFYEKESDVESAMNFLEQRMIQKQSVIYIALNEVNENVGFVQLYPIFSSTRMQSFWLLNDLYVDANYRGKSYGEALIAQAKELVKTSNACGMMLETAKDNLQGNHLYVKTEFELDTEHNYYYWNLKI